MTSHRSASGAPRRLAVGKGERGSDDAEDERRDLEALERLAQADRERVVGREQPPRLLEHELVSRSRRVAQARDQLGSERVARRDDPDVGALELAPQVVVARAAVARRRDLAGEPAGALDDEQRPAARHRLLHLEQRALPAAGEDHRDRLAVRELGGDRREQRRLAAPLVAVGEHEVRVVGLERRRALARRPRQLDEPGRRDADQHGHPRRIALALGAEQRHHAGRGAAVDDRGIGARDRGPDRRPEHLARGREVRLAQVVGATGDDDHRPRGPGREAEPAEQLARMLAGALDRDTRRRLPCHAPPPRLAIRRPVVRGSWRHHPRPPVARQSAQPAARLSGGRARATPSTRPRKPQRRAIARQADMFPADQALLAWATGLAGRG